MLALALELRGEVLQCQTFDLLGKSRRQGLTAGGDGFFLRACRPQNAAEAEEVEWRPQRFGPTVAERTSQLHGKRGERDDIQSIVVEDRLQASRIAGAQVVEIDARNLRSRHIALPADSQNC